MASEDTAMKAFHEAETALQTAIDEYNAANAAFEEACHSDPPTTAEVLKQLRQTQEAKRDAMLHASFMVEKARVDLE